MANWPRYPSYWPEAIAVRLTSVGSSCTSGTPPCRETVVAKLAGIETREQALSLKGSRIAVARTALPDADDGRYYLADLVGLEGVNEQGLVFGVVRQWFTNGPQDVMEVAGERVRLIPWVPTVVKQVDLGAKRIEVEWGADW